MAEAVWWKKRKPNKPDSTLLADRALERPTSEACRPSLMSFLSLGLGRRMIVDHRVVANDAHYVVIGIVRSRGPPLMRRKLSVFHENVPVPAGMAGPHVPTKSIGATVLESATIKKATARAALVAVCIHQVPWRLTRIPREQRHVLQAEPTSAIAAHMAEFCTMILER